MHYTVLVVFPVLCTWLIALPAIFIFNLLSNRDRLYQGELKAQLGVFYGEYREVDYFYWDILMVFERIVALVVINLATIDFFVKGMFIGTILVLHLLISSRNKPYKFIGLKGTNILGVIINLIALGIAFLIGESESSDSIGFGGAFTVAILSSYYFFILIRKSFSSEFEEEEVDDNIKMIDMPQMQKVNDEENQEEPPQQDSSFSIE